MRVVLQLAVAGIMVGTLYGLVAFTVTLLYRTTGVLSFAHGGFALIAAYSYGGFSCRAGGSGGQCAGNPILPPFQAALAAVAIATTAALLVERLVIRPLEGASGTRKFIATAAVLGLSAGVMLQINGPQARAIPDSQRLLPKGGFTLAHVAVDWQRVAIFVVSLVLVGVLAVVLRRTWFGLGLRAAGQDAATAQLMGVKPIAVARFNWALAGAVSGLAGVLVAPLLVINVGTFSFLMVKAVGASLIGGLVSLPVAFLGGIAIGLVEGVLPHFFSTTGASDVGIAVLVITVFTLNRKRFASFVEPPAKETLRVGRVSLVLAHYVNGLRVVLSWLPKPVKILALVLVALLPLKNDYYGALGTSVLYYTLAVLSIYLIIGLAGQPSLMQAGFVGIGAFSLTTGVAHKVPFLFSMVIGLAICAVIGGLSGLVSMRFRRLQFAVVSLTLGAVISQFLLSRPQLTSNMSNPTLFGLDMLKSHNVYLLMGLLTILAFWAVRNVTRSGWGTSVAATRELQTRIAHMAVNPQRTEVTVFAFSAVLAGLAGCLYALITNLFNPSQFIPLVSVTLVLAAVVGGFTSMWGALLAGLVFGLGPEVVGKLSQNSANAFPQIASGLLALILIVKVPGGLASLFKWARTIVASTEDPVQRGTFRGHRLVLLGEEPPAFGHRAAPVRVANGHRPARGNGANGHPERSTAYTGRSPAVVGGAGSSSGPGSRNPPVGGAKT